MKGGGLYMFAGSSMNGRYRRKDADDGVMRDLVL